MLVKEREGERERGRDEGERERGREGGGREGGRKTGKLFFFLFF